jgi:diguanylate cyclase (GGDEF)-like protein
MLRTADAAFEFGLADWLIAEIAVVDADGLIVRSNRKWDETASIGLLAPRPAGWNYIEECARAAERGCEEAPGILAGLRHVLDGTLSAFIATYVCPFEGLHHWFQVSISPMEFGGERHTVLMHVNVSALQVDTLTGLPNRAMFDAQLDFALATARERNCCTGILVVDMNNLKSINDLHGHQTGDEALKMLGAALKARAGPDSVVARIGGDEFGVVLPTSLDALFAPRMRAHFKGGLAASIGPAPNPLSIGASIGVAVFPDDGLTSSELLRAADRSMYAQKRGASVA